MLNFKKIAIAGVVGFASLLGTATSASAGTYKLSIQNNGGTTIKSISVFGGEIIDFERIAPNTTSVMDIEIDEGCVATIIVKFQVRGNLRISNVDFCQGGAGYTISRK